MNEADVNAELLNVPEYVDDGGEYRKTLQAATLQFLNKRFENTKMIENAKQRAISQLVERFEDEEDDIPISQLLSIIRTLGDQNVVDLNVVAGVGKGGKTEGGDTFNIFNQEPQRPQSESRQEIPPGIFQKLDSLVQISEAIIAEKGKNDDS